MGFGTISRFCTRPSYVMLLSDSSSKWTLLRRSKFLPSWRLVRLRLSKFGVKFNTTVYHMVCWIPTETSLRDDISCCTGEVPWPIHLPNRQLHSMASPEGLHHLFWSWESGTIITSPPTESQERGNHVVSYHPASPLQDRFESDLETPRKAQRELGGGRGRCH